MSDFTAAGAQVFVVVPHERCRAGWWADRTVPADKPGPAAGQLVTLADPGFWVSSMYGVAFQMQIHTDVSNTPGTFLVDKQGVLRWAHRGRGKANYGDRPTVQQTLAKVRELADGGEQAE